MPLWCALTDQGIQCNNPRCVIGLRAQRETAIGRSVTRAQRSSKQFHTRSGFIHAIVRLFAPRYNGPCRVAVPCCLTSFFAVMSIVYLAPLFMDYSKLERYVTADCTIVDYEVRQRECYIQVCNGFQSNSNCQMVRSNCHSCRYQVRRGCMAHWVVMLEDQSS